MRGASPGIMSGGGGGWGGERACPKQVWRERRVGGRAHARGQSSLWVLNVEGRGGEEERAWRAGWARARGEGTCRRRARGGDGRMPELNLGVDGAAAVGEVDFDLARAGEVERPRAQGAALHQDLASRLRLDYAATPSATAAAAAAKVGRGRAGRPACPQPRRRVAADEPRRLAFFLGGGDAVAAIVVRLSLRCSCRGVLMLHRWRAVEPDGSLEA